MPGFSLYAQTLQFDLNSLANSTANRLEAHVRQAAREFLRAIIKSNAVPIQTGMAMGSFLNLSRFLNVAVPRGPGPIRGQRTYVHSDGKRFPNQKGPELGASFATQPEDAFKFTPDSVEFKFETDVYHYILNEFGLVFGPWNSFEIGREAALAYSKANFLKQMPKALDFLIKTELRSS